MIFPTRFRYISLTIFFLIWGYLIYCYFSQQNSHQHTYSFNYKSRVDSTITLIENWKFLITRESTLRIKRSNYVRDSVLRELKKKPKVLIIPKEVTVEKFITIEANPKVMSVDQSIFIQENAALKSYNNRLQHEIDSLNNLIQKLQIKKSADSLKNKPTLTPGRRFLFFKSWRKKPSGPTEETPEFR